MIAVRFMVALTLARRAGRCRATRDLVDLRHRVALSGMPLALRQARRLALPGHADRVDARQPPRGVEVADVAVDLRLEQLGRQEARDVERDHELPDIEPPLGGAAKSRTSRPKAAPLSGSASSPMTSERPEPL